MSTWLDTTGELNPPRDGRWKDARWLVGRHPRMQSLCERVGAVDDDKDGRWPDVDTLADVIRAYDAEREGPWVRAFGVMSSGEKRLLRVLATMAPGRVGFSVDDTSGLDDEGHAFVRDWARIILG